MPNTVSQFCPKIVANSISSGQDTGAFDSAKNRKVPTPETPKFVTAK